MKRIVIILLFISLCYCFDNTTMLPPLNKIISDDIVREIRETTDSWTAYDPEENPLRRYTDSELKRVLGMPGINYTKYKQDLMEQKRRILAVESLPLGNFTAPKNANKVTKGVVNLPTDYNWVTQSALGGCMPPVYDQGSCGGCYSFSSATVFSARRCVAVKTATGTQTLVEYSHQDVLSCNVHTDKCDGGIIDLAFKYIEDFGVTTRACQPYAEFYRTDKGSSECRPSSCTGSGGFSKAYCKKGSSVMVFGKNRIKYEIYTYGPVSTYMDAYSDLANYKSGVYRHVSGENQGGHAVVIIGWGVQNSVEYWIVRNSWGASWGMSGNFNIAMDDAYSGLGEAAYYCIPEI